MDATELLFILGGSYIGARLGDKYLGNTGERPVWNGHIGNDTSMPAVAITVQKWRARLWYRLFIADQGDWVMVGISQVYAEILAMIQQWERYPDGRRDAERLAHPLRQGGAGDSRAGGQLQPARSRRATAEAQTQGEGIHDHRLGHPPGRHDRSRSPR